MGKKFEIWEIWSCYRAIESFLFIETSSVNDEWDNDHYKGWKNDTFFQAEHLFQSSWMS